MPEFRDDEPVVVIPGVEEFWPHVRIHLVLLVIILCGVQVIFHMHGGEIGGVNLVFLMTLAVFFVPYLIVVYLLHMTFSTVFAPNEVIVRCSKQNRIRYRIADYSIELEPNRIRFIPPAGHFLRRFRAVTFWFSCKHYQELASLYGIEPVAV